MCIVYVYVAQHVQILPGLLSQPPPLALADRPGRGWSQPGPGGRHPPRLEAGLVPAGQDCQEPGGGRPGQSTRGDGDEIIDAAIYYNDKMEILRTLFTFFYVKI